METTERRYRVEIGDTVEIIGGEPGFNPWVGLRCVVTSVPVDRRSVWLTPQAPRPDSYGLKPFYWPTYEVRVVES